MSTGAQAVQSVVLESAVVVNAATMNVNLQALIVVQALVAEAVVVVEAAQVVAVDQVLALVQVVAVVVQVAAQAVVQEVVLQAQVVKVSAAANTTLKVNITIIAPTVMSAVMVLAAMVNAAMEYVSLIVVQVPVLREAKVVLEVAANGIQVTVHQLATAVRSAAYIRKGNQKAGIILALIRLTAVVVSQAPVQVAVRVATKIVPAMVRFVAAMRKEAVRIIIVRCRRTAVTGKWVPAQVAAVLQAITAKNMD